MTVVSKDGHDLSGTTANRPTNCEPGMTYFDTDLGVQCVANASGVLTPLLGQAGSKAVTAAGTSLGTATALSGGVLNVVTAADGVKGVVLPAVSAGSTKVFNNSSSSLKVYPPTGNTINGGTASAAVLIKPYSVGEFFVAGASAWGAILSAQNSSLTIGASTAAAGTTTSDAGVLPAGTAQMYPTTGANGTAGVRISASDDVASRELRIGNGVSNQILKVYPPSGGTINGASADAAFSSVSGKGVIAVCSTPGTWYCW